MKINFVGDIMPGELLEHFRRGVRSRIARREDPFAYCRSDLQDADLSVANLECVLSDSSMLPEPWSELLRGEPAFARMLREAGIGVVNTANNHALDHGRAALCQSLRHLREAGIQTFGYEEDSLFQTSPLVVTREGFRVGFLGYNLANLSQSQTATAISQIEPMVRHSNAAVDFLIVSLHWGYEYVDRPTAEQIATARRLLASGCDLLYGHHSHRLQGVTRCGDGLFAPSLGNFVFDELGKADRATAVLATQIQHHRVRDYQVRPCRIRDGFFPVPAPELDKHIDLLKRKLEKLMTPDEEARVPDRRRASQEWEHLKNRIRIRLRILRHWSDYTKHRREVLRYFFVGGYYTEKIERTQATAMMPGCDA